MGLLNKVIFDDIDSSNYGVYIAGDGAYNAPARRGEMVTVPGRNGSLFFEEDDFENIEVTYPAFMAGTDEASFRDTLRNYRSALSSKKTYCRIEDTYHPDEFRLGVFHSGFETEPKHYTTAGDFNLVFDCKPQRFLLSGETGVTFLSNGSITNPTPFTARPLIKVTGNGTASIGDYQFTVAGSDQTFWLDSELMEAYIPAGDVYYFTDEQNTIMTDELGFDIEFADGLVTPANMLKFITFKNHEFPLIEPGTQRVELSGGIVIEIVPRWWML